MNTVLSTPVDEQHHNHPPSSRSTATSTRRVTLPDRVALHLGLALITWSRRPQSAPLREHNPHALRELELARAAREDQWARTRYLVQPWR